MLTEFIDCAGILEQSMGARNRVGIGLSYRPARLHVHTVGWRNQFLGIDSWAPYKFKNTASGDSQFLVYIKSCWYFQPSFLICTLRCCPSLLLSSSSLHPSLHCVCTLVYMYIMYRGGGGGRVRGSGPKTDKHLPRNPFIGQLF